MICNVCHVTKPESEFTKVNRSKDGTKGLCKECKSKRDAEHYKRLQKRHAKLEYFELIPDLLAKRKRARIGVLNLTKFTDREQTKNIASVDMTNFGLNAILKEIDEPYRMLTSRAEYRLLLRQDNADLRLCEKGREIGLVSDERWRVYSEKKSRLEQDAAVLKERSYTPADQEMSEFLQSRGSSALKDRISLWELLRRPEIRIDDYVRIGLLTEEDEDILEQLEIQSKYEGYIRKQEEQVRRFEKMESKLIPPDIEYDEILGLSNEARHKFKQIRPESIGQASRVFGINPADINILLIFLEKKRRK